MDTISINMNGDLYTGFLIAEYADELKSVIVKHMKAK